MAFPSDGGSPDSAGGQGRTPVVRFTTAEASRADRLAAWRRTVSALFDVSAPRNRPVEDFSAALTAYHFGAFLLCHSRADAARYSRSGSKSRRDDLDHYLIHLPLQQGGGFGGAAISRRLRPMDVGVFDMAQPARFLAGAGESISLIVPRAALSPRLQDPNRQHGRVLRRDTPMGAVLARHMIALYTEASRFGLHEASALADAAIGLLAICLGFGADSALLTPSPARENLARKIRIHIEQNLHRESLTPDTIIRDLSISRSQLYRQFELFGGVRHYIRRRRLRQCLLAICSPLHAGQRIADIAYDLGFGDEAHFSRVFREAFGMSPRAARMAAQRGDGAVLAALAPAPPDATAFTHWIRELMAG